MNKPLTALIACTFASFAAAQPAAPRSNTVQRQADVRTITEQGSGSSTSTQKTAAQQAQNVKASKQVARLSKEEKIKLAHEATRLNVNPENSSGQAVTATMQMRTVVASRGAPKQNTEFKTREGKAQLAKALQQQSTQ